ncbi:MAG TPA: isoaspartyl peptidase/L-asparaginase [Candidatus Dormibacteraeota bacterium]|nr:isoaspartyl peptidase/L-asparaginase [Candidatus Dormibacteraeota bacterium]
MTRVILVHGGAGAATKDEPAYRAGLLRAAETGWSRLEGDGDAVAAAVAAVAAMEDDPVFNAGYGSVLNASGEVECDAAVMRGADRKFGAIASVRTVRNPVLLAHEVLDSRHVMVVGEGAVRFGARRGVATVDPAQLITQERFSAWAEWMARGQPVLDGEDALEGLTPRTGLAGDPGCDTVGAVALDGRGRLAAATSTGGISFKLPGRVGDSPLPGCGFWADGRAAASSTGEGEKIARVLLCRVACERAAGGDLDLDPALADLAAIDGSGGLILLAADGSWRAGYNTEMMGHAWRRDGMAAAECAGTRPSDRPA